MISKTWAMSEDNQKANIDIKSIVSNWHTNYRLETWA